MNRSPQLQANEVHIWCGSGTRARRDLLEVLGRYTGRSLRESDLVRSPAGKPTLPGSGIHFSIADSGAWTALAVSKAPVGIDIEVKVEMPDLQDVAACAFAPHERAALADCPAGQRHELFYRVWTRKEALLKAVGCGLSLDPRLADTFGQHTWRFHDIAQVPGCAGSVATPLPKAALVFTRS